MRHKHKKIYIRGDQVWFLCIFINGIQNKMVVDVREKWRGLDGFHDSHCSDG
jgi:hypothetical protein